MVCVSPPRLFIGRILWTNWYLDLLRSINDPEHPLTLEQLGVVSAEQIKLDGDNLLVQFTPTVPHCGMATLIGMFSLFQEEFHLPEFADKLSIGLSLRVRMLRSLPKRFKIDIQVKEGSHQSEHGGSSSSLSANTNLELTYESTVNKQLNDKERVAAALENSHLLDVVNQCLSTAGRRGQALPSDLV